MEQFKLSRGNVRRFRKLMKYHKANPTECVDEWEDEDGFMVPHYVAPNQVTIEAFDDAVSSFLEGTQATSEDHASLANQIAGVCLPYYTIRYRTLPNGWATQWYLSPPSTKPPQNAEHLLHFLLPAKERLAALGDLEEEYHTILQRHSVAKACF